MNVLNLRPLNKDELSFESLATGTPIVLTPSAIGFKGNEADFLDYLTKNAQQIKNNVSFHGLILFRGFPVNNPSGYQNALNAIGYDLYKSNCGSASPRTKITDKTFVSTKAPQPFIIGFHTEFCYQSTRPAMVSFYCEKEPAKYGETPLFDCSVVFDSLNDSLKERLEKQGVCYRRFFYGKKSLINFRKTWQEAFLTSDKSMVEKYLDEEGMKYHWNKEGNLATEVYLPAVITDSNTGKKCLSVTMFNEHSFAYNFWHFQERYHHLTRYALEWFVRKEYRRKDSFLQVSFGDGKAFSRAESEEIQKAAWNNAIAFRWQLRDFVIIDNIRFAHSRLNVKKPRSIIAAMGDKYEVRDYKGSTCSLQFPR